MSTLPASQPDLPVSMERLVDPLQRMVLFAYEIGAARHKPRAWQYNLQENVANVAEHVYRVTFMAMLLATMEGADVGKTAVMSLIHDCDEIRAMDLTPYQKPYMQIDSDKAVHDTFAGTPLGPLAAAMFGEYKAKESLEAKCVKDADVLDTVLELMEISQRGSQYLQQTQETMMQTRRTAVRTASGQQIFDAILAGKTKPWDWFLKGPSTFKDGTYGQ